MVEDKRIVRNAIRCKHCGDVIASRTVHEYVRCSCGTVAVDGGLEYLRRSFRNKPEEDFEELSEYGLKDHDAKYTDI